MYQRVQNICKRDFIALGRANKMIVCQTLGQLIYAMVSVHFSEWLD